MNTKLLLTLAGSALAVVALAGCTSMPAASTSGGGTSNSSSSASAAAGDDLSTASTGLGTIVVDGKGLTAYYYDSDTANSGMSTCSGACASLWPAITSASATPKVEGVTGTVGTITGVNGDMQITIDGRPIYTYASDSTPGDTTGQGFGGVWHVVAPNGDEIK